MTLRDDPPEVPPCPTCSQRDRVEVLDVMPKHDPNARYFCERCNLPYKGSLIERQEMAAKALRIEAERGLRHSSADAGRAAGVIEP